jgi:hypothetical protein
MVVGSYAWGLASGGVLSDDDRVALTSQLTRFAARFAASFEPVAVVESVPVPDSPLAKDAYELCSSVSEPWLVGHCVRTYLFAAGFGAAAGVSFDAEILYVASLLHDLGITSRFEANAVDECFALTGAREALSLSSRHELAGASVVADAISRHLNVDVDISEGAEAHLLSFGVTLDVGGIGVDRLPSTFVASVLAEWPRGVTGAEVAEVIRRQALLHPSTRSGFLREVVHLDDLAQANALDRL